jgi:hypothetical protein
VSVELATRPASGAMHARESRAHSASPGVAGALALRLVAFFALAWVAGAAYATLLVHPPQVRVFALAATATAAGAALTVSARPRLPSAVLHLLRALIVVLALALALVCLGVPPRLLTPAHWDELGRELAHGVRGLGTWLWPYRGSARWTRIAVLTPLAPALVLASALCFWPSERRRGERRLLALGVLLGLLVTGLANASPGAWRVQGVLLTALLFVWFWLPRLTVADASRAGGWLLACVLAALLLAPVLEGGEGWFGTHAGTSSGSVSFRWDELFAPIESPRSNQVVLTVAAPAPALLRVTSLDRFDGQRFLRSASPPATRALDLRPGPHAPGSTHQARISIAALRSSLLVGGGGVTESVRWPAQYATNAAIAPDGTLTLARPLSSGANYLVDTYVPHPSPRQLRAAPRRIPAAYAGYTKFELPAARPATAGVLVSGAAGRSSAAARRAIESSPYAPMFDLARRLTDGTGNSYEVALNIERFLRSNFAYTETPPRRRYPLEAFLFQDRRGYCQQFAGAMALMLRMDGIPARVGVGFRPSLPPGLEGSRTIRASDAHAWAEAYFAGIGWVSFDPTPAGPTPALGSSGSLSRSTVLAGTPDLAARAAIHRAAIGSALGARGSTNGLLIAVAAIAVAVAIALAGLLLAGARRVSRALQDDAEPAIEELSRALERSGWPAVGAATLTRVATALRGQGRGEAAAYVELLRRVRFAEAGAAAAEPDARLEVAKGRAALRRALSRRSGLAGRLTALYELPPAFAGGRLR